MIKKHPVHRLITPSWLSGITALSVALLLTGGAIIIFMTHAGVLQQHLLVWQQDQRQTALTTPDETLPENDRPSFGTSWPLIIGWGFVGLLIYGLSSYIVHTLQRTFRFNTTLKDMKRQPRHAMETLVEHLLLRIIATVALFGLLIVVVRRIIPYCVLIAHASASDFRSVHGFLYALLSVVVLVLSMHIITIFLRLSLGKIRIFS